MDFRDRGYTAATMKFQNRLLSTLPASDQEAIWRLLEPATLTAQQVLEVPNELIEFAYFPESGLVSVIASDRGTRRIETGPFGREGMSGLAILLGLDRSPHETRVQLRGDAHRIRADALRQLIADRSAVHALFLRYVQAFSIQTADTLVATAHATLEVRLIRCILMLHDRMKGDDMAVMQDLMAVMLAVRRAGVTDALHVLEGAGLIRSTRGRLQVLDRAGLEKRCGSFYGVPEAEYERLVGTYGGNGASRA